MRNFLTGLLLLPLFLSAAATAQGQKVIAENVPASLTSIYITTGNARVHLSTRSYGGGISNVALVTSSNVVISSPTSANNIVFYATGTIVANGAILSTGAYWSASGNDIYKNNSGNVGIGTSAPTGLLDINNAGLITTPGLVLTTTGTVQSATINCNGFANSSLQGNTAGCMNLTSLNNAGPTLVIVSSRPSTQEGDSALMIRQISSNWNDPLFRIFDFNTGNSSPQMRWDCEACNLELVSTSTSGAIGRGKWEPFAMADGGIDLQVNSRAYDDSTFQNVAYWNPLSDGGGLTIRSETTTNNTGVMSSSDTAGVEMFTLQARTVGLTVSTAVTASWWFAMPSTFNNQYRIMFQTNNGRGGNKNARQWEFTGQDFQYDPNVGVKISSKTLVVDGNATNAMILPGTGNVGIGSRAPTALLHVSSGTLVIDGTGAPVTASALCLDASGRLGHCTSIVGVDGTCTCTSP